jgi:hypothetical protein
VFIKWRSYHFEADGIKVNEYVQLPIVVKSFRLREKGFPGELGEEKAVDKLSCIHHEKLVSPKQGLTEKPASYPVCMVIYLRSSQLTEKRDEWWQRIDSLFWEIVGKWPDTMNAETVKKLKADIEEVVPRIDETSDNGLPSMQNDSPSQL